MEVESQLDQDNWQRCHRMDRVEEVDRDDSDQPHPSHGGSRGYLISK